MSHPHPGRIGDQNRWGATSPYLTSLPSVLLPASVHPGNLTYYVYIYNYISLYKYKNICRYAIDTTKMMVWKTCVCCVSFGHCERCADMSLPSFKSCRFFGVSTLR